MLQHPRSVVCTTLLIKKTFFGLDFPHSRVREFERWMGPYESVQWPAQTMAPGKMETAPLLDPVKIVRNITASEPSKDKVLVIFGSEDKMMQGTQFRIVTEYAEAIRLVHDEDQRGQTNSSTHSGVGLVEIDRAGHHLQNDVQW